MEILVSELFQKQLKEILEPMQDQTEAKNFKMYLDTLIINIPTKLKKYKSSIYFDDNNFKDLEYNDYKVVFFVANSNTRFIILGIIKNK